MSGALVQTALIIVLGVLLKRRSFVTDEFWSGLDRVVYWVFLPCLFLGVLAHAEFAGVGVLPLAAAVILSILLVFVLLLGARPALGVEGPAFTSVVQGAVRFNSYVALATIPAAFGDEGLLLLSLLIAVVVPLVNVLSVLALSLYGAGAAPTPVSVIHSLVTNPLIAACALGLGVNLSGMTLPAPVAELADVLARAALPCGLLAVGAALRLEAFAGHVRPVVLSLGARFVLLPLVSYALALWLGLSAEATGVLVLFQVQPTATAAYMLARQLGGDAEAMATIITAQTLLAFGALPVVFRLVT